MRRTLLTLALTAGGLLTVPAQDSSQDSSRAAVLFELDFAKGCRAIHAAGDPNPAVKVLPRIVTSPRGHAARFADGQELRYPAVRNLNPVRGALSMWIQSPLDGIHGDDKQHALFAAGNSLRLALGPTTGVRADETGETLLRVYTGSRGRAYFIPENVLWWHRDEWHHVLLNWDSATGELSAAVDGRMMPVLSTSDAAPIFTRANWQSSGDPEFSLGGGAGIAMGEVRIFSRPLTAEEARREFLRTASLQIKVHTIDAFLFAAMPQTCRLVFENRSAKDADLAPAYDLTDAASRTVASGQLEKFRCPAEQKCRMAVTLRLPSPGEFRLSIRGDRIDPRPIDLMAISHAEEKNNAAADRLQLVAEANAGTQKDVIESAPSRLVASQLGTYREAGGNRNDRFLLRFEVKDLGKPHVAVIAIPDDKPRTMEVVLQRLTPPGDTGDYQAQTGVFTGDEYPISNRLVEHRILFWPTANQLGFIFMTAENGYPAAVEKIGIYKLADGFSKLPVRPFRGSVPAREIGFYYEDPVLHKSFSATPLFPGFGSAVDTLIDYMEWFGQNTLHYPMVWYNGPLYGSDVEPFGADVAQRSHPYDYPRYLMKRLETHGMTFNGGLHIHDLASLAPYAITDEERVLSGEETAVNMQSDNHLRITGYHDADPAYNPLDPHVQAAVKAIVKEIADRYGDEPAFTGLSLVLPRHKLFAFGSIASGYNDINLTAFQRDTGIRIPVDPPVGTKDRQRFAKSYGWLMANARQAWIDWRCRKIHDYYKELADILSRKRKDLKLTVNLFPRPELYHDRLANYISSPDIMAETLGESGLDPNLFTKDLNIVVSYTMVPADYRFYRIAQPRNPIPEAHRTAYIAPEVTAPLRKLPNGAWAKLHDRYFENSIGQKSPMPGLGVKEVGWRVSTFNPASFNSLEYYALAMNNFDALDITKGGFVIGTYGTEPWVGRFAQAFRALPAVRFDDVEGLADPVRVRQAVVDGRAYFYLLNCLPATARVSLDLAPGIRVTDLVAQRTAGESGSLGVELQPYELRSYVADSGRSVVLRGITRTDAGFVRGLETQLRTADSRAASDPHLKLAHECMSEGRYARLFRLLQESWNHSR